MDIKGGYKKNILRVDLSTQRYAIEELPGEWLHKFIGGRGLGAKLLYEEMKPGVDPLSPENKIFFTVGPLTGTTFPTSARTVVTTKSPLTKGYLYSVAGGKFGLNLKRAGFDSIVLEGKSEMPVYLEINGRSVKLKDASFLSKMKTTQALYTLKEIIGSKYSIAVNGPAGESQVPIAGITTDDHRQFGRGGAGAVLGSKGVKAIAITGDEKVSIFNEDSFNSKIKTVQDILKKQPGSSINFPKYGSGHNLLNRSITGCLPTKNWNRSTFEGAEEISMYNMRDSKGMVLMDRGCYGCPVQCGKLTTTKSETYYGYFCDGPEYETLYSFGSNLCVNDPNFVVAANSLCDELGLDTMSAGIIIGFLMECQEKGILTSEDLNGYNISFKNPYEVLDLLEDMAYRRGMGDIYCRGVKEIADYIGRDTYKFAMHVKGMELGGYEPRSAKGQAIVFAAGNRGGCHHSIGLPAPVEINNGTGQIIDGKGKLVKNMAVKRILLDSFTNCTFAFSRTVDFDLWAEMLTYVTGLDFQKDKLTETGERINTIERLFNLREGFTINDDVLPKRIMEEPLPDGPAKGEMVTQEQLSKMLKDYFDEMGWDEKGVPTEYTLERLKI